MIHHKVLISIFFIRRRLLLLLLLHLHNGWPIDTELHLHRLLIGCLGLVLCRGLN